VSDVTMGIPLTPRAADQADRAASQAGIEVRLLKTNADLDRVAALFCEIWDTPVGEVPISPHLLRALELAGNYLAGAFDPAGGLVGASVAFATVSDPVELHSHITGVGKNNRGGVGYALKLDQRAWALAHGICVVTWTFDPLVRRNAFFNLAKLGAVVDSYLENVYGEMTDGLNAGVESDRLFLRWHLDSGPVDAAAEGSRLVVADTTGLPARLRPGPDGAPVLGDVTRGGPFLVRTPPDIEALRRANPGLGRDWRLATRLVLEESLASGITVSGVTADGDYVMRPSFQLEGEPATSDP
jgi:predicted GNAT superfamily acetyltransferase